jgi:hypothetical protein
VGVKKISLFDDQREEFGPDCLREAKRIRFLAFYPLAAALFGYFFQLKGKSNSPSGCRTGSKKIKFPFNVLKSELKIPTAMSSDPVGTFGC